MTNCGCFSLRYLSVVCALVALLVTVINPLLNHLIDPIDEQSIVEEHEASQRAPFDPSVTDVMGYEHMGFTKQGQRPELWLGPTYIMVQSFPRWAVKLMEWYSPVQYNEEASEMKTVDIRDARKAEEIVSSTFAERGFTLLDMSDSTSIEADDWRSTETIRAFQKDLEPRLLELFPGATRIEFTSNVVRGGSKFGDQPAAINGPHLDYTQDDSAREDFHQEFPAPSFVREPNLLLGQENTDEEEMLAMVGIWKPVSMATPVCDHPLAVMDARTFAKDHEVLYPIHINFGFFVLHNLNGAIHHHDDQRWYYYPFQNESEVLVFTQYSKDRHFCNPHGSFRNPNCPGDSDPRISVEMRAGVFFKKEPKSKED